MKAKRAMKRSLLGMLFTMAMLIAMSVSVLAAEPTNVVQISSSETSVKVQWTGVSGAQYYGIQTATDAGFTNIVKQDYETAAYTQEYISGLVAGATYYVRVGWGADRKSCYANFSAPIEVVTEPTKVNTAKFVGADDVNFVLTWDAVPGANVYYVEYNGQKIPVAANSAALPYATGATSARVTAARVNTAGTYVAENTSAAWVSDVTALTSKIAKDNFGFTNAWTSINVFQIAAVYNGHGMEAAVYDVKTGKKKFSGSAANTSYGNVEFRSKFKYSNAYKYRVRPYITTTDGQKIYGSWSDYSYFVNPKKCTYTQSGKKIKLSWSKLTGVSKIKVQISTKENSGYKTCATLSGKKTTYTITKYGKQALKKGKKYYIRVSYYSKSGKKQYKGDIISATSLTLR